MASIFEAEYKKLNKEQKEAVEIIDGPVMVVAGPGTGKTQILALRIANILKKTDIKPDGILCLTFTNSAVDAMRERLVRYIGETGRKVNIFTFHGFGMKIIEEYFKVLGLSAAPKLLNETETAIFFDEILNSNDWEHLRPRADQARYFGDLKSLISLLKRERISRKDFASALEREMTSLIENEDSISTRGESKGELKKEVQRRMEGLEKSKETAKFMEFYEQAKKEKNILDYDDVLENLVKIVETSKEALSEIRERYLYVLIDEHQDSSRVQNEFLEKVWSEVEQPNIFVVGDDRQLIYGFSGASIDHFRGFIKTFPGALLIPLIENYRSTQIILDAAHALLPSLMSDQKLVSQSREHHPIKLVEAQNFRAEILAAALDISAKGGPASGGKDKINFNDCAVLVPKNAQARDALEILYAERLPVSSEALSLFDQKETGAFLRVLQIIGFGDIPALALSFFDEFSDIKPLEAHKFIAEQNMRGFSLDALLSSPQTLFDGGAVEKWILKLAKWKKDSERNDLKSVIQTVGRELFGNHRQESKLVSGEEIAETLLALLEKKPEMNLRDFVSYLEKLESYGETIPLGGKAKEGIKVLTMHSSKGLEFDYVWIAHMDEKSLTGGKKIGFTLPESIAEKIEERDIDAVKRKLYVAITRAKRFCTLSYALESHKGGEQIIARIIADLPKEVTADGGIPQKAVIFEKRKIGKIEKAEEKVEEQKNNILPNLTKLVTKKYTDRYVSASLLNNFFECPWKWYFNNLLQLPTPPAETLEFGNVAHASIDTILKMKNVPTAEDLKTIIWEKVSKIKYGDERTRARMEKEALKIVLVWTKNRLPEIKLNRKTEESLSIKDKNFPHLKIYGKIDLIENLASKEVRVTDFKTGSVRKKYDIEKLDEEGRMSGNLRQLAMYSYLLHESPQWQTDARESRLEFLEAKNPKETIYNRAITLEETELLKKDIRDYDRLVKSGEWTKRECHFNSYGKNTECQYCKLSKIYE